jgi:hypothetical protein
MRNPEGKFRSFPVSSWLHEQIGRYRGAGTYNTAMIEIQRRAFIAMKQGANPKIDYAPPSKGVSLDEHLVIMVKLTAETFTGKHLNYEDAFRVVVALAGEAKE